ncbi:MAG: squalene/phytoene synthase family protein [Gemmataceae bacterium]|nr:squalene/phytoene synthase family protein [Gemmataceae bacterium]
MTRTPAALSESFAYCEALARREAGNFYPAFRILPAPQRRAMCALYAFMRIADDRSDDPAPIEVRRGLLEQWRSGLDLAIAGRCEHPSHAALCDTIETFRIPPKYLHAVIDGVEMDLEPTHYETLDDLLRYCWHVASAVGLACIHIWGFTDPQAKTLAEQAGYAFQITNILRDLKEDALRDRVYLPAEDLARFGVDPVSFRTGLADERFQELMRFETERARAYYDASAPLAAMLPRPGRAVYLLMSRTYRGLLDEMERRRYDVFSSRVRVSRWRKLLLALQVLPVRYGWG